VFVLCEGRGGVQPGTPNALGCVRTRALWGSDTFNSPTFAELGFFGYIELRWVAQARCGAQPVWALS
jgi:hypothetical protein